MTEQLKPCPFCGSEAKVRVDKGESLWSHEVVDWTAVCCTNDDCSIGAGPTCEGYEPSAIEAWNRRAQPAQAGAEPVAFVHWPISGPPKLVWYSNKALDAAILKTHEGHQPDMLLYTHPPARVPLTDDEVAKLMMDTWGCASVAPRLAPAFAKVVIAAYEDKNGIGGGK